MKLKTIFPNLQRLGFFFSWPSYLESQSSGLENKHREKKERERKIVEGFTSYRVIPSNNH